MISGNFFYIYKQIDRRIGQHMCSYGLTHIHNTCVVFWNVYDIYLRKYLHIPLVGLRVTQSDGVIFYDHELV